ncbi:MAG: YicC family protein [Deltaproteobacteria bacterium]|nr:YicC family protein [Deltaproteobacteria bacterium]
MGKVISMTGFGRGEARGAQGSWTVELRAVNHRYLDIGLKLPRRFMGWEERIKKEIGASHVRGRVDAYITFSDEGAAASRLKTDLQLAREYLACLEEIAETLALPGKPDLAMLASYRDIITPIDEEMGAELLEELWDSFREALGAALDECRKMRQSEGERLAADLLARLHSFQSTVAAVEHSLPGIITNREATLKERLDILLAGVDIDPMRLAQEVAILVDKSDVTEEIVRLHSHIEQFQTFLGLDEPVGRRLDFLVQELLREVNTVASKISNAETAHMTVAMKNDLEKIREQVQNLE